MLVRLPVGPIITAGVMMARSDGGTRSRGRYERRPGISLERQALALQGDDADPVLLVRGRCTTSSPADGPRPVHRFGRRRRDRLAACRRTRGTRLDHRAPSSGRFPGLFGWFWEITYVLSSCGRPSCWSPRSRSGRRSSLARDQWLALVLASLGSLLLAGDWRHVPRRAHSSEPPAMFPAVAVALIDGDVGDDRPLIWGGLTTSGQACSSLGASALASVALGGTLPMGAIAGIAIGTAAATIVHLLFGSPGGRPHRAAGVGGPRRPGFRHRRGGAGPAPDPRGRRDARHHDRRAEPSW